MNFPEKDHKVVFYHRLAGLPGQKQGQTFKTKKKPNNRNIPTVSISLDMFECGTKKTNRL